VNVLVACEYSGVVREAFKKRGHYALSVDLLPTEIPGNHYQGDLFDVIYGDWDLIIAHPPCTYLSLSGNKHYARTEKRRNAVKFVEEIWDAGNRVCIENPVGVLGTESKLGKATQYIHPWMFGDPVEKKTGLWLKGLPKLVPTHDIPELEYVIFPSGKRMGKWYYETSCLPHDQRGHVRSKTFQGIANAMAKQWG
jgi:hypothetical protein